MTAAASKAVHDLLAQGIILADASTWGDEQREISRSGPWHYVNVLITESRYDPKYCPAIGCVVSKIGDFERVLQDPKTGRVEKQRALTLSSSRTATTTEALYRRFNAPSRMRWWSTRRRYEQLAWPPVSTAFLRSVDRTSGDTRNDISRPQLNGKSLELWIKNQDGVMGNYVFQASIAVTASCITVLRKFGGRSALSAGSSERRIRVARFSNAPHMSRNHVIRHSSLGRDFVGSCSSAFRYSEWFRLYITLKR